MEPKRSYHGLVRGDVILHVPPAGGTLLDVGGGVGATAARLKEMGHAERVGVIDRVQAALADFSYIGDLEQSDLVEQVSEVEGPFRTILALDVLEHLVDPWNMVKRLHQALEVGGTLIASIPNVRNYRASLQLLLRNDWTYTDAGILDRTHLRFFVRKTAIELMVSSGLELQSVIASPSGGGRVRLFRQATFGLLNSFTDQQYIISVRRPI